MEQHNKTEQDFSDKLNQREIMPSAQAWDRLDAMLTVAEQKKSKRGYGWLYIAASIFGFLLIGTVFLSQTEPVVDQGRDQVVFENQTRESITNPQEETIPTISDSGVIASTENQNIKAKSNNNRLQSSNQNQQNQQSIINQKTISPIEAVNPVPDNQKLIASTNPIIPQKTDQPSIKVDELLAAAQSTNANPKTSVKVNAKSLLSEVDQQVNLTFREKMLRRASEVAEVVANRNVE
jgi:hypothetical protein